MRRLRVAFMGSPDFAVAALQAVAQAHDVVMVYAQPPRPAGRGKREQPTAVQRAAETLGLPVRTPVTLKTAEAQAAFAALDLDVAVVAAYGLILPQAILDAPRHGCLNIHPSLLPRWRGAAPLNRAIMAGDATTGVCIMRMEAGLDTGPWLIREETPIGAQETAGELQARLAARGAALMTQALVQIAEGSAQETPQPDQGVTYATKIDKAEARIDWSRSARDLDAHIRGLSPFPGAWCDVHGERLKVLLAAPTAGAGRPGEALDDALTIACGDGALRILRAQRAGKGPMEAEALLRGFSIPKGAQLG